MTTELEQLIREVQSLPLEERKHLRQVIDESLASADRAIPPNEEEFQVSLVKAGLLADTRRPIRDVNAFRKNQPFSIAGEPLSETIVEERR
jgi:hypothetical protein